MSQSVHYRFAKPGVAATLRFTMLATSGNVFYTGAAPGVGDCKIGLDGTAPANTTNLPTHNGSGVWSLVLTAAETIARYANVVIQNGAATYYPVNIAIACELRVGPVEVNVASQGSLGADENAIAVAGIGTGAGLRLVGGATGDGIQAVGGATSGAGIAASTQAGNSNGISAGGRGTGVGFAATHATDNSLMTNLFDTLEGTEPAGAIAANSTFKQVFQYLKRRFSNKVTQTNSARTWYKDNSSTVLQTQTVSNDGTTQTQEKAV